MSAKRKAVGTAEQIERMEAHYLREMAAAGYQQIRRTSDRDWVALYPYLFTVAIVEGRMMDRWHLTDRWCYASREDAEAAFAAWDGINGEPDGWIKHPASGRCRYEADPRREVIDWEPELPR